MKGVSKVQVSPLELMLDTNNPRFLLSGSYTQESIRDYLLINESILDLILGINETGGLLPGERIVVRKDKDMYIVVEGNRRTCSLQLLLSRDLIPQKFVTKIPATSANLIENSTFIEVDVVPDEASATSLMAKRHIEGVKQWKPLAKKRFFAGSFDSGKTIESLSEITDISKGEISKDIKEYKMFYFGLREYEKKFKMVFSDQVDIIDVKLDRFIRLFNTKVTYNESKISVRDLLELYYDEKFNPTSKLKGSDFTNIIALAFKESIVDNTVNTRGTILNVSGVKEILDSIYTDTTKTTPRKYDDEENKDSNQLVSEDSIDTQTTDDIYSGTGSSSQDTSTPVETSQNDPVSMIPETDEDSVKPGGPGAVVFFESLSWDKLSKTDKNHHGLLAIVNELYKLSTVMQKRRRLYEEVPVASGMLVRSLYEQCLIARLKKVNAWSTYMSTLNNKRYPELKSIEEFVAKNLDLVFPTQKLKSAFNYIHGFEKRNFLNENIHNPGNICVTKETLEGIAANGLRHLVQELITEGLV